MEDEVKTEQAEPAEPKKTARRAAKAAKETAAVPAEERAPLISKEVNLRQIVTVRNGFQGRLVYQSRHSGETFVWDEFGAEQDMELGELRNAKSSSKNFFINNWFMFDEPWIVAYLGLEQYYRHAVRIEDFDRLFSLPAEEMAETIAALSDGQKRSVAYRAHVLIAEGAIDSNRTIAALERCLGVELVDRSR